MFNQWGATHASKIPTFCSLGCVGVGFFGFFVQCESQVHHQKVNATFPKLD
jgi:hypothetical protein